MSVFVLDKNRKPLDPCSPARARKLLSAGRAAVLRRYPFTIILKDRTVEESTVHEHRLKIDPGSKVTGMAVAQEESVQIVFAAEIVHRGQAVHKAIDSRRVLRRGRRARKTRYREPRFLNRTKPKGWLPPSLESRIGNVLTWVERLRKLCPVTALSQELVRFDLQKEENPEIVGVEYQQGTLAGYKVREYLLEKWQRTCAYCRKKDVPLQIDHIHPKSRGGSDRVSNLALACESCNQRKGNRAVEEFLMEKPEVLAKILWQARSPLKDAAAVNTTRWELWRRLTTTGLPVECGSGGLTKFNRTKQSLPKAHWLDAACVGLSGASVQIAGIRLLQIKACGHGKRQRCCTDEYGFPRSHSVGQKFHFGFQTGDIGRAVVRTEKYVGAHAGRITTRSRPCFRINGINIHPDRIVRTHCADGYDCSMGESFDRGNRGDSDPSPIT